MMRLSTTDGRFQTTIALEVTLRKMATQIATTANSTMWGTLTLWKYGDDPLDPLDPQIAVRAFQSVQSEKWSIPISWRA
jgi:hypothetical protein